ncbi:MAG: hypothetical protein K6F75_01155 [Butyrivibrio sp.]|nr:hypothetical protein [Butyrivibrio sp.]
MEIQKEIENNWNGLLKKYLRMFNGPVYSTQQYGIHTVVYSSLDSKAIYSAFENFIEETGNNEIDKLISFGKEDLGKLQKYESCQDLEVVNLLRTSSFRVDAEIIITYHTFKDK